MSNPQFFRHTIDCIGDIGFPTRTLKHPPLIDNMSSFDSGPDTFRFLDLTREMQDRVHEIILNDEVAPPAELDNCDRSPRHVRDLETRRRGARNVGLLHELQMPAMASYGLLCSNRRLAGEMREALERESWTPEGLRYKIDCMAENGDLHSTSTPLPAPYEKH